MRDGNAAVFDALRGALERDRLEQYVRRWFDRQSRFGDPHDAFKEHRGDEPRPAAQAVQKPVK
jgi:hypothetical protein